MSNYSDRCERLFMLDLFYGSAVDGRFGMPIIHCEHQVPEHLISFRKALHEDEPSAENCWIHFYVPDPDFSCLFRNPWRYVNKLSRFQGAISPDPSVVIDLPIWRQMQSVGESRTFGAWFQRMGLSVIPNVRWGGFETFSFAFDGVEPGGTIALGTTGCMRDGELRSIFSAGLPELLRRCEPSDLVVYGSCPEDVFECVLEAGVAIHPFETETKLAKEAASDGAC